MISTFRPLRPGTWVGQQTPAYQRRSRWTFKAPWSDTLKLLDREIDCLRGRDVVVEADFSESDIRLDGMPKANARQPQFPGVRIFFDSKHGPLSYQADSCEFWQHNVRSIALGLEALRAVDRYGITHRAEQYTGFKALSSPTAQGFQSAEEAWDWLRATCPDYRTSMATRQVLRRVARVAHPDAGGSREEWDKYEQVVRLLKQKGWL